MSTKVRQDPEDHTGRVLQSAAATLQGGKPADAARELLALTRDDASADVDDLLDLLKQKTNADLAASLIDAFVHLSCYYCKSGRSRCETCEGRGHVDQGKPCEACIGLGVARCDFCDGSGWVPLGEIPASFRLPVLEKRLALGIRRIEKGLKEVARLNGSQGTSLSFQKAARLLIHLDRQMGVLENALMAAKDLVEIDPQRERVARKVTRICVEGAEKAWPPTQKLLEAMARTAGRETDDPEAASRRQQRARLCASLAESDMLNATGLEHPFLRRAVNEMRSDKQNKPDTGES